MASMRIVFVFTVCCIGSITAFSVHNFWRKFQENNAATLRRFNTNKEISQLKKINNLYVVHNKRSQPTETLRFPEELALPTKRSQPNNELQYPEELILDQLPKRYGGVFSPHVNQRVVPVIKLRMRYPISQIYVPSKRSQPSLDDDDSFFVPNVVRRSQPVETDNDFTVFPVKRSQPSDWNDDDFTVPASKRSQPAELPNEMDPFSKRSQPDIDDSNFSSLIAAKRAHSAVVKVLQARKRSQPDSDPVFDGFQV